MKNKYSSIIADYFYNRNNPPKIYLKKDYEKGSLTILAQQSFKLQSRYNIMEKRISKLYFSIVLIRTNPLDIISVIISTVGLFASLIVSILAAIENLKE